MKKGALYSAVKEAFWGTFDAIIMFVAGVLIASFFIYEYQAPDVKSIPKLKTPQTSIIYDRTGTKVLYEIHGEENRKILSHEEIPNVVRAATIAAEDKAFYFHKGIDLLSIIRALWANIEQKGIVQGGSTITQQLARNLFLTREKTVSRKFLEAILAIKIERNFSKSQILDLYLNEVPYGSNAYGISSAAQIFFGKEARNLTLDEAAFLAALPKAPSHYSPYGNYSEQIEKRKADVLRRMRELGLISEEEMKNATETNTLAKVIPFKQPIVAPHFVFYVIENLEEQYGRDFLETGGLKVITTLDMDLQEQAEKVVQDGVLRNQSRRASNAALAAVSPKTGDILAMVGSWNYFDTNIDGKVNVTIKQRQPGSSFKPIVYATAFENGYQPETLIADVPTDFGPDGSGGDYIPRNYDGKFHGVLPMRKTLAMSLNIPAVKTLSMVGLDKAIDMAHRLGITTINDRKRYGLSLAIGGAEVKLLDMAAAFSVFANDGVKNPVHAINKIDDSLNTLFVFRSKSQKVLDSQVARKINSILSDNDARTPIFGSNSPLHVTDKNVAAKTGTTQEFRDAWTIGYTPSIAVGVWAGNNDSRPMQAGSDGVFVAAPIWRQFMDRALSKYPDETFISYEKSPDKKDVALDKDKFQEKNKAEKKEEKKKKKHG